MMMLLLYRSTRLELTRPTTLVGKRQKTTLFSLFEYHDPIKPFDLTQTAGALMFFYGLLIVLVGWKRGNWQSNDHHNYGVRVRVCVCAVGML